MVGDASSIADILLASMLRNAVGLDLIAGDDPLQLYMSVPFVAPSLRPEEVDEDLSLSQQPTIGI